MPNDFNFYINQLDERTDGIIIDVGRERFLLQKIRIFSEAIQFPNMA